MKIHYISHHSILEYDEIKLLTELGHEVYGNGSYRDPKGAYTLPRPGIEAAPFDQQFFDLTAQHPKTNLPKELIEPYDVLIFMSGLNEGALVQNWPKIKHKRVIWRTIGQSTGSTEYQVKQMRKEGLQIVRYSPKEENIQQYCGADAVIRFYKDPEEFDGWVGDDKRPVVVAQSLKGRAKHCHYETIMGALSSFDKAKIYGTGNDDLGAYNGGELTYENLKKLYREARVLVYAGTWPASYTLTLIEAMMTGIPIVAISKKIAHISGFENIDFYEVDEIIRNKVNGFACDTVEEMRDRIAQMIKNQSLARSIGQKGRATAIEFFGKEKIKKQWQEFLEGGDDNDKKSA